MNKKLTQKEILEFLNNEAESAYYEGLLQKSDKFIEVGNFIKTLIEERSSPQTNGSKLVARSRKRMSRYTDDERKMLDRFLVDRFLVDWFFPKC